MIKKEVTNNATIRSIEGKSLEVLLIRLVAGGIGFDEVIVTLIEGVLLVDTVKVGSQATSEI